MLPAHNIDNELTGQIITLVCESWGITRPDLVSKSRRRPLPWARAQLCEYLRRYAGHDTVSCAALLHRSDVRIGAYYYAYAKNRNTYLPFREHDDALRKSVRELCNRKK